MSALTVLVIRHGEKPSKDGYGFDANCERDQRSLIARGWQRAGAWASLFGGRGGADFPMPAVIYATKPTDDSRRPLETITPLAERLGLVPRSDIEETGGKQLAGAITALTGVVLVCWEHKNICRKVLPAFLKKQELPNVPAEWDGTRFDVVFRLDRAMPDAPWSFRQMFPRLLGGDSDSPM